MEANKYAFRAVGHACDAPDAAGIFPSCDRSGQCHIDVLRNNADNDFGPGQGNTINTDRPFSVETSFHESGGVFTGYTTVLEQDGRTVVLEATDCAYLGRMSSDMTDMVFAISNWGSGSLDWLQHGVCTGTCSQSSTLSVFSNLQIFTGAYQPEPPAPPVEPVEPLRELYYAKPCPRWKDTSLCTDDCECFISWPADDPLKWRSAENACRCLPKQMAPEAYEFRKRCANKQLGSCSGCDDCRHSWPTWDTLRWRSAERMCRC